MTAILAAILTLMPAPAPHWNESKDEFLARMAIIAQTTDRAVSKVAKSAGPRRRALELAVIVTYWGESHFAPDVHSGARLGDQGRAICLGQHQQADLTEAEWASLAGTDYESSLSCAVVTASRLQRSWRYCRNLDPSFSWGHAFALYGSGRTCRPEELARQGSNQKRVAKLATLLAR